MKKRLAIIAATFLTATATGCGNRNGNINLYREEFEVNVGSGISTELKDYVRAPKKVLQEMTLDLSEVNKDVIGVYTATINYKDESKTFRIKVTDTEEPEITLERSKFYFEVSANLALADVVKSVNDYSEVTYGFSDNITAADSKKNMINILSFDKVGKYNCEVIARDEYGNCAVKGFEVNIVEAGKMPSNIMGDGKYSPYMNNNTGINVKDINSLSTDGVYYGIGNTFDKTTNRPNLAFYELKYGDYKVDFIQPESNYVWLTFNEILEYGNTDKILDTLKEKNVSAVFFITKNYAEKNPELIKRMIDEGHVLGNYTDTGEEIPGLSVNSLTTRMDVLYNYVYETYGYEMYLFRAPSGYFSEQALALAGQLGYRTVFWSYAYSDWDVNNQPEVSQALSNALNKAHGGAIYQLSGSSSTNRDMLGDFIDGIRSKGLEFAVYDKN